MIVRARIAQQEVKMSDVKRYDYGYKDDGCGGYRYLGLIEKPDGALVRHSDYAALEAECDKLRAQVSALQSDANSWQSGYDKGREDGAKAAEGWKAQHARDSAELRRLCAEREALHAEAEALRVALLGIASVNPAERGIEWAKSYASDGLKGAGSELYARWLETFKEAEALRAENARLRAVLAEQGERQGAVAYAIGEPDGSISHLGAIYYTKAGADRHIDSYKGALVASVIPLYTTPQPSQDVRALVSADDVRDACANAVSVFTEVANADQCREVAEYMREVLLAQIARRQAQSQA